jgi:hypothetical protein
MALGRKSFCVSLVLLGSLLGTRAHGQIHQGVPPVGAQLRACPSYFCSGQFQAAIEVKTSAKEIVVKWEKSASGDFTNPDLTKLQTISTAFWPNCVEVVGGGMILVAGKDRDGDTRIERWTLPNPLTVSTSQGTTMLLPQGPQDLEVVYEGSVVGKDMVRFMLKNEGSPGMAFVQFYDSRSLYEVNYADEPFTQTLVLDVAAEPNLQQGYAECMRGEHSQHGYVYVFSTSSPYVSTPALVLRDVDNNGTIDSHQSMPWTQYAGDGYASANLYLTLRGR